jgi:putative cobalt transporter subunit CbtB
MTSQQQFRYIHKQLTLFRKHHISLTKQAVVVVCAVAFVVSAVLFTNVPSMHDFFHGLRHAMGIIPCH